LSEKIESWIVPRETAHVRLDQFLVSRIPGESRSQIQNWIRRGLLTVNGKQVKTGYLTRPDDRIQLRTPDTPPDLPYPEEIPLTFLYQDADLAVIDKPAGLVVHPGSGNWDGTLLNALLHRMPALGGLPRAGIVHRLDKDTSGLLVVAKTLTAQTDLVRQLQARTVKRQYLALVQGEVQRDGSVVAPIGRHPTARTRMAVTTRGKPAMTHYRVLQRFRGATLLECTLETGRTHQIRVHLASIGHPLVGDPVYRGGRGAAEGPLSRFGRQALHATRLALVHPRTGERLEWESPAPADLSALLAELG